MGKSSSFNLPIFLVGMPGVGKTMLGKLVASNLGVRFLDLDDAIEQQTEITIQKYILLKGQEFFRIQEALTLRKLAINTPSIISCGGGCPCFHDNIGYMNLVGHTIFLNIPLPLLIDRYQKHGIKRPLMTLSPTEYLTKTYDSRISSYSMANHTASISNNIEQNVNNIISLIKSL